jgi:hypothetical protein
VIAKGPKGYFPKDIFHIQIFKFDCHDHNYYVIYLFIIIIIIILFAFYLQGKGYSQLYPGYTLKGG